MLKLLMRWVAAHSWGVALIWFRRVIPVPNREYKHPLRLFCSSSSQPPVAALQQEQQCLQEEITTKKGVLQEEKELNVKRQEDILNLLAALNAKLSPPAP